MNDFWNRLILKNTVADWLIALSIIVVCIIVLRVFQNVVVNRIRAYTSRTKTTVDDFIVGLIPTSIMPLLYVLTVYIGTRYLLLPAGVSRVLHVAVMVVVLFFFLKMVNALIRYLFRQLALGDDEDLQLEKQTKGIVLIIQCVVWVIGFLFLINNLGYNITTLIAGLGIGGIAIALAAQTILGDLFSYFVIFFDKPFKVGDFITLQDKKGTIEHIGIKTTRIRALGGEQLICSNTDLTNSRVHNFKRMEERRILFTFGIVYNTPASRLKMVPQHIKNIIEQTEDVRFDRAHFKEFGEYSLVFEVVYFVLSPDYNIYMDTQQAINVRLFELFEEQQIGFAFPTRTIIMERAENNLQP